MLVSNFQVAKFYLQPCLAFSTFFAFLTCLLLLQPCNFANIKMSCRKNRSEILAPHLVTWLPPSLAVQLHSSKQMILRHRISNGCRNVIFASYCLPGVSSWGETGSGEMGHPNTLCFFPITAEGEFKSFKSLSENPGLSGLAAEYLSLGQPRGATARRKRLQLPYQFVFQGQRTLQLRTVAAITLPGAQVQQPLIPFQWHLFQQCQVPPQGHQSNGVWLNHLCSHADLPACEQTTT